MKRRALFGLAALWLAGCAAVPVGLGTDRDRLHGFVLEGRFALRHTPPDGPAHSSSGRLSWTHQPPASHLLIASPLGHAVAEIEQLADGYRLRLADGRQREADDPEALVEAVTGERLPVAWLPAWLLGRPGAAGELTRDALGRPLQLREAGWAVDYAYDEDRPEAPPARLRLTRADGLELRLRIEEWKATP